MRLWSKIVEAFKPSDHRKAKDLIDQETTRTGQFVKDWKPEVLDRRWRDIIDVLPVSNNMDEFLLVRFLVNHMHMFSQLERFPYIYAWEFPIDPRHTDQGVVDLIFWDGRSSALVVEVKSISDDSGRTAKTRRTKHRRDVQKQARDFATQFKRSHPTMDVGCWWFTNESLPADLSLELSAFLKKEWQLIEKFYESNSGSSE